MYYTLFKYLLFRPVCRWLFRPWVRGAENIPAHGGAVLAGNHLSAGETFLLPAMIHRRMTFPAKAELFRGDRGPLSMVIAWFLTVVGQVPMDRSGGRASAVALLPVLDVLEAGGLVGIFPEGTRSPDGRLYRGRTGVARLALGAGVPVLPVGFVGTELTRGPFGIPFMKSPGITIGTPLDFSDERGGVDDPATLRRVTNVVMAAIQDLTGQDYVDVNSNTIKHGEVDLATLRPSSPIHQPAREP